MPHWYHVLHAACCAQSVVELRQCELQSRHMSDQLNLVSVKAQGRTVVGTGRCYLHLPSLRGVWARPGVLHGRAGIQQMGAGGPPRCQCNGRRLASGQRRQKSCTALAKVRLVLWTGSGRVSLSLTGNAGVPGEWKQRQHSA